MKSPALSTFKRRFFAFQLAVFGLKESQKEPVAKLIDQQKSKTQNEELKT